MCKQEILKVRFRKPHNGALPISEPTVGDGAIDGPPIECVAMHAKVVRSLIAVQGAVLWLVLRSLHGHAKSSQFLDHFCQ